LDRLAGRFVATPASPVISMTSLTREALMSWVAAMERRCERALPPGCTALASSRAPTSRSGARCCRKGLPLTVTVPDVGRSSPIIMRMVVDLPAPFGPRNPGDGPRRDREAEGVHGGGVAVALGELACLDHDRDRSVGWGGTECSTANTETGDRAHGWRERRMVGRGAGSHVC